MPVNNKSLKQKPVIFLTFANARGRGALYFGNLAEEQRGIREKLEKIRKAWLCEVVERTNTTIEDIVGVFQDKTYGDRIAIFHYAGYFRE
jgi:hypothetical protein